MSAITFKSCPKVYIHETHRSKMPVDTLHFVEGMRNLLGMRDFRDATSLDRIGIPVYTCWRLRPDESKTFHTGKGVSPIQAQCSVTFESIERYSSEFREEWSDRLIAGVAYLFGARSWAGIALVLVVTVLVALTLASLLATRAQFAAGRRLYEREILPELQAYAEKNHLTLEQIGDTAVRNLPKEALLCSYLPVSPYQGFEE